MVPAALTPIRRNVSLTKEVVERLRRAILTGELAEGDALPEAQTAAKFGVSRVPVREALVELERQGLVQFESNGRASVRPFTDEDEDEILSLRAALQTMAARLAATKLKDADVARLESILAKANDTRDLTDFSALDTAFHDEIVGIANHRRLSRVWTDLRAQMELWLSRRHRQREKLTHDVHQATLASHREMIEVLKTRKPKAAAELMEQHCSWKDWPPRSD
ncbi:MAG TPA: GntR family transcriptional regulator [Planctomycetota bacterium]|nr:GntR family transcriptional regulator [Planctomycetota bacterium]